MSFYLCRMTEIKKLEEISKQFDINYDAFIRQESAKVKPYYRDRFELETSLAEECNRKGDSVGAYIHYAQAKWVT